MLPLHHAGVSLTGVELVYPRPAPSRLIAVLPIAAFPLRHHPELRSFPPFGVSSRKFASSRASVSTTAETERAYLFSHVPLVGLHGFEP